MKPCYWLLIGTAAKHDSREWYYLITIVIKSTGSNNTVGWCKLWAACEPLCKKSDAYSVCMCAVALHRLSHLCPSAPVVSPRPRVPRMHCFHVNAFRHREIIFSLSLPFYFFSYFITAFPKDFPLSSVFLSSVQIFFLWFLYWHYCPSSVDRKTYIDNPQNKFLIWGKSCAPHGSLAHILGGGKDCNTPHTVHCIWRKITFKTFKTFGLCYY